RLAAVAEEFGFAGLDFAVAQQLFGSARQTDPRRPLALDGPASADIEIALVKNGSMLTYFLATGSGDDKIVGGTDGYPKPFLGCSPEPDAKNSGGQPGLRYGPVELPLDKQEDQPLRLYPRDIFGRWPAPEDAICRLTPWPIGAPDLLSALLEYFD